MAAKLTVLVVAPDRAMRRSLTFALEAEGYRVDAKPRFDPGPLPQEGVGGICAIVDEDALTELKNPAVELSRLGFPVILLVERVRRMPDGLGLSVIEKPPLGRDLLDAVAAAFRAGRATYIPVGR